MKLWKRVKDRLAAWYCEQRYGAFLTEDVADLDTSPCIIAPVRTHEMRSRGTIWAKTATGGWREVCDFCGGNCGQCGMTERLGNPGFSFDRIIDKSGMKAG